jgi:hypothetical protein
MTISIAVAHRIGVVVGNLIRIGIGHNRHTVILAEPAPEIDRSASLATER